MPAITTTSIAGSFARNKTETTLNGTNDSLVYNNTRNPILCLRNPTAGALSPTIIGSAATTISVAGIAPINVSAGYPVGTIAAGAVVSIPLNTIFGYLSGAISLTGGAGLVATLLEH